MSFPIPFKTIRHRTAPFLGGLCGLALLCGCAGLRGTSSEPTSQAPRSSYRIVAEPGAGAARKPYTAHLFPPIRMSKSGAPSETMTPVKGPDGAIRSWTVGSARSRTMAKSVEGSFRRAGYGLVSFPELLAIPKPYSVVVVSTFYTDPAAIPEPVEGGPDHTITVKVKGALFGLDLDPANSLPVGTVLCTGFYSKDQADAATITGKLLAEAVRNLGDQFEGFGEL